MSEKITFQELIESIAEETDNSRQYTQDFIKNFVEVINDGLEEDGKVNIAGFGKFNLKRVDERQGYNPQKQEKITIPAHNKIVFKPYKDVRERVNAPYAHLEPELIKKEDDKDQATEVGSTDPAGSEQSDFIPTGPPTAETETEDNLQNQSDPDEDIVEFKPDSTGTGQDFDEELNEFLGSSEQSDDKDKEKETANSKTQSSAEKEDEDKSDIPEEDSIDEASQQSEDIWESIENKTVDEDKKNLSTDSDDNSEKRNSAVPLLAAAVIVLSVIAGGVWYFSTNPGDDQPEMIAQESVAPSDNVAATNDEQPQPGDEQANDEQSSQDQQQTQSPTTGSATTSETSGASSSDITTEGVEIERGQTLWSLAEEKYGNPRLWPWIYGNNESVRDPDRIYAGTSLSVPLPSGTNNTLNAADSVDVAKGFLATYHWHKDQNSSKAKDHLWGAKVYHDDIRSIADVKLDKADLKYANRAR